MDEDLIVFDPPVLNFGRVIAGSVVSKEVWIINRSDTPVTVVETKSTCGCTVARVAGETINPGGAVSTIIRFTAPTRGEASRKQVRFRFEGDTADQMLAVVAEVVLPVVLEPRFVEREELGRAEITIESANGQPFRVHDAKPSVLAMPFDGGTELACVHHLRIDPLLWYATGQPDRIDLQIDHPEVVSVGLRIRTATPSPSHWPRDQSASVSRGVVGSVPTLRLSADRLRFGNVSDGSPSQLQLVVLGSFAPDANPELRFDSALADLSLVGVKHTPIGLVLSLQLTATSNRSGYLRSALSLRIGSSRAWCDVFAAVNLTKRS